MGVKCETQQKNLAVATVDFNALQLKQSDKPDLAALDGSIQKVGETYAAYRDCVSGSHSSVKRIDPPKKTRKGELPIDTPVGKPIPESQQPKRRRNLDARQGDMPLDTPVGKQ